MAILECHFPFFHTTATTPPHNTSMPDPQPTSTREKRPWECYAISYRFVEFLVAVVLLGLALLFSLIDVHDRMW